MASKTIFTAHVPLKYSEVPALSGYLINYSYAFSSYSDSNLVTLSPLTVSF